MNSRRRIAANRANALLSTGPNTPEGRAAASINAITHGLCCASHVVHPQEDAVEFEIVRAGLLTQLAPQDPFEHLHAERIIATAWRLRRVPAVESWLYWIQQYPKQSPDPSITFMIAEPWRGKDLGQAILTLNRHEAHLHRMLMRDLADYRSARQTKFNVKVNVNLSSNQQSNPPLETPLVPALDAPLVPALDAPLEPALDAPPDAPLVPALEPPLDALCESDTLLASPEAQGTGCEIEPFSNVLSGAFGTI